MNRFVRDKSANILNFLAMNRIVTQFDHPHPQFVPQAKPINITNDLFIDFFNELNKSNIKYITVGHIATAYHGYPRTTEGIEIWFSSDVANIRRLQNFPDVDLMPDEENQGRLINFNDQRFFLYLLFELTYYSRHDFYQCLSEAELADVQGVQIPVLGRQNLIREKMVSANTEDLKVIEILERTW